MTQHTPFDTELREAYKLDTKSPVRGQLIDRAEAKALGYSVCRQDYAPLLAAAEKAHLAIIKEGLMDNDMAHHDRCLDWRILDQQLISAIKLAKEGAE